MRVTKTIREFIEKEVSNRLDAKYTAEKEEADFQTKVEQEVREVAMDAAQKAYDEYMASVFTRYDFLEDLHTDKERRCVELRKFFGRTKYFYADDVIIDKYSSIDEAVKTVIAEGLKVEEYRKKVNEKWEEWNKKTN